MKPNAPSQPVWLVGMILGLIGIISRFVAIPSVSPNAFYILAAGFVALALGTTLKGL